MSIRRMPGCSFGWIERVSMERSAERCVREMTYLRDRSLQLSIWVRLNGLVFGWFVRSSVLGESGCVTARVC